MEAEQTTTSKWDHELSPAERKEWETEVLSTLASIEKTGKEILADLAEIASKGSRSFV